MSKKLLLDTHNANCSIESSDEHKRRIELISSASETLRDRPVNRRGPFVISDCDLNTEFDINEKFEA